jgi:4-oxalomesaconate tautomerase
MSNQTAIPFMQLRGGSSKGVYFRAADLPADGGLRDAVLRWVMGPYGDPRQIDGLGGADTLTSKIAIVARSDRDGVDVDYSFIQAMVGEDRLDDTPNCGNILAGVGAFALESGMLERSGTQAEISVFMTNSGNRCTLQFPIRDRLPVYEGDCRIDGVPGSAAPIICNYADLAGSACGALLPTGRSRDEFAGFSVTCIDNGMPVVALRAADFGVTGDETPDDLNANETLKSQLEAVRLEAGQAMGLGDVSGKAVPKMCLISPPRAGGTMNTRTFIPKVCHKAIGVLGAVSAASAAILPDSPVHDLAVLPDGPVKDLVIEHPSGDFAVRLDLADNQAGGPPEILRAGLLRTARLLSKGEVFVPRQVWEGNER